MKLYNIKRTLAAIIAVLFLTAQTGSLSVAASREDGTVSGEGLLSPWENLNSSDVYIHVFPNFMKKYSHRCAVDKIVNGIKNYQKTIDISGYRIYPDWEEWTFGDFEFRSVIFTAHPELSFLETISEESDGTTKAVVPIFFTRTTENKQRKAHGLPESDSPDADREYYETVKIRYDDSVEKMDKMRQTFEECADRYIRDIDPEWSDVQKVIYLHDKMAQNIVYKPEKELNRRTYQAMTENKSNCAGISAAFSYLLSKVGIHSEIVGTDEHNLNKVMLDGEWFVVDVLWDDEEQDGKITRDYFLISDKKRKKLVPDQTFFMTNYDSSDRYDKELLFRTKSDTAIAFNGSEWYFINSAADGSEYARSLLKYDPETDKAEVVRTFSEKWSGTKTVYSGIACFNGVLYYNTPNCVYSYDIKTKKEKVFAENDSDQNFVGLIVEDGNVYAETAKMSKLNERERVRVGQCLNSAEEQPLKVNSVTLTGNGGGRWLNGEAWNASVGKNQMTRSGETFTKSFYCLPHRAEDYKFTLTVNGDSLSSFGCEKLSPYSFQTESGTAVYGGEPVSFNIPEESDYANVTITLNTENYSETDKSGATVSVTVRPYQRIYPGDVNADNMIDKNDLTDLKLYVAGHKKLTGRKLRNTDVNRDGVTNKNDSLYLKKYLNKQKDNGKEIKLTYIILPYNSN